MYVANKESKHLRLNTILCKAFMNLKAMKVYVNHDKFSVDNSAII